MTGLQVAVFDTAFHQSMPAHAYMYALPYDLYEQNAIRKYGFHGTSYLYLLRQASRMLKKPENELNLIACHIGERTICCCFLFLKQPRHGCCVPKPISQLLCHGMVPPYVCCTGAGASMCAIEKGKCIDTSMGLTPLEG